MAPTETERARWEEALAGLAHRIETAEGYLLALVVGAGDGLREAFACDMAARLAPRFEVRPVEITAEAPNPLQPLMDLAGIENVVVVPYGLAELSKEERKHTLHLLNWSRSQLTRRPMKVVLWVEPDVVAELYQFAGDFADWWSELVELPTTAPEPRVDPFAGRSRWDLMVELEERWAALQRIMEADDPSHADLSAEVAALFNAVKVDCRPGQVLAGARLIGPVAEDLWLAVDLESGEERIVRTMVELADVRGFVATLRALRQLGARPGGRPRGVVRLCAVDDAVVAFSTERPGGPSLARALAERSWSVEHRINIVLTCVEAVLGMEALGLFLRQLRPRHIWLDGEDLPVFIALDGFGKPGEAPDTDFEGLVRGYQFPDDRVLSQGRDVFMIGLLLVFVVSGQQYDKASLQWMEQSPDPMVHLLAKVATRATQDDPADRHASLQVLSQDIRRVLWPAYAKTMSVMDRLRVAWSRARGVIGVLILVGFVFYGAWGSARKEDPQISILKGQIITAQQQIETLTQENAALKEEVQTLKDYIRLLKEQQNTLAPPE